MKASPLKFFRIFQYDWSLIRKFLVFTFLVAIVPIIFLCALLLNRSTKMILESEHELKQDSLRLYASRIDFRLEMYNIMANAIFTNLDLQNAMLKPVNTIADLGELNKKANESVQNARYVLSSLLVNESFEQRGYEQVSVNIYAVNLDTDYGSVYIHPATDIQNEHWYGRIMHDGGMMWEIYKNGQDEPVLRIVRLMRNFETLDVIGILTMEMPLHLMNIFTDYSFLNQAGHTLVLFDKEQNVFAVSKDGLTDITLIQSMLFSEDYKAGRLQQIGGNYYYVFDNALAIDGWSIGLIVESPIFRKNADDILLYAIATLTVLLLVVFLVSIFIYKSIIFRMRNLINKILLLSDDAYLPLYSIEGKDEIGVTDQALNNLILRMRELIETEYRQRLENVTLRFNILQEQINPHLLYNTLGMIEWSAKKSEHQEILAITTKMIRFYRNALNTGETVTTIRQEIQMVSDYIALISFAYELAINTQIEVNQELYESKIIKLIIQPIVENAIIHGLRYAPIEDKNVRISCKLVDKYQMQISVEDNGIGMDAATRKALLNQNEGVKSYGLKNVVRRLQLFYEDRYSMDIISELNRGTTINITIQL